MLKVIGKIDLSKAKDSIKSKESPRKTKEQIEQERAAHQIAAILNARFNHNQNR